ncbi:MAG: DUF86 domain-containing protein [Saprospiraceae bacterium]|nr:DUF86 domain-containing protein [Saprospiraceae bacterium]
MQEVIKVWLEDIERAIAEINQFLPESKNFIEFSNDLKTKRAIERNIEIIGEAMSRILNLNPDIPIANSRKIVDTRNRIIHGYDSVSDDVIWLIVIRYLPLLEQEIKEIIKNG